MVVMASSRDLISIFIALEMLSIPAYMLATWRKRDPKSNEAGLKYYLMGVFATAIMLYGMSLIFGVTGTTVLADIGAASESTVRQHHADHHARHRVLRRRLRLQGVGGARSTRGRPTPTKARRRPSPRSCRCRRRAAGFVAILTLIFVGFFGRHDVWEPMMWVARRAHHDGRQPGRAAADEHRPPARVLVDRAGRLHPGAAGRRR